MQYFRSIEIAISKLNCVCFGKVFCEKMGEVRMVFPQCHDAESIHLLTFYGRDFK